MFKHMIHGWNWQRHALHFWVALLVLVGAVACIAPEHKTMAPPQPPPPEIINSPLVDTTWRLEQVSYQGRSLVFGAAGPIHLIFDRLGGLEIRSWSCGSGDYVVAYLGGPRYQLANPTFLEIDCRGPSWTQFNAVVDALEATGQYELDDEQLVLRGVEAELRLVIDNS